MTKNHESTVKRGGRSNPSDLPNANRSGSFMCVRAEIELLSNIKHSPPDLKLLNADHPEGLFAWQSWINYLDCKDGSRDSRKEAFHQVQALCLENFGRERFSSWESFKVVVSNQLKKMKLSRKGAKS